MFYFYLSLSLFICFFPLLFFFSLLAIMSSTEATRDKYDAVRKDIIKVFPDEDYDDGSFAPVW